MNITGTIELYYTPQSWMADFDRASNRSTLMAAFKSHILPLPYTPAMPGPAVRSAVASTYPFAQVIIRESENF